MNFIKKSTVYQLYNYQKCTLMAFHYFDIMFFFVAICFINSYKPTKNASTFKKKCLYIITVHTIINDKNVALIKAL